jgi:hypothetical protein
MVLAQRNRFVRRGAVLCVCLGGVLTLAACSSSPPRKSAAATTTTTLAPTTTTVPAATTTTTVPPATTTVPAGPACTMAAIAAGIPATSPDYGTLQKITGFGCSGAWAYADIVSGTAQSSTDGVVILQSGGTSWTLADRASACNGGQLPATIQQAGCTTS